MPRTNVIHQDGQGQIIHAADVGNPDQYLAWLSRGVYVVTEAAPAGTGSLSADPTGTNDSTAAIQEKLTNAPAGSTIILPPGTYLVSNLTSTTNVKIRGAGRNKTTLKAKSGSSGTLLSHSSAWGEVSDLDVDLTAAPTMDGVVFNNTNEVQARNVRVLYGSRGIAVTGASGSCYYDRLYCKNQTTAGVQIGEGGAEHHIGTVQVLVDDAAITMASGFEWTRTAATDLGGLYGGEIRVTRSAGTITTGINLHSTVVSSFVGVFGTKFVADNINGGNPVVLQNVDNLRLAQLWMTGTGGYGCLMDGATNVLIEQWFASCAGFGAYDFAATNQAANWIDVGQGRCTQGNVFHMPTSGKPTNLSWSPQINYDNAAFSNDFTSLINAVPGNSSYRRYQSPCLIPTLDTGGGAQCFGLYGVDGGAHYYMRVDAAGKLQMLPDAFDRTSWLLDNKGNGTLYGGLRTGNTGATIFSGSGVPGLPATVTSVNAGDYYFRTDTPTTANQRLYVCVTGGATPTWVGIV